MPRSVIFDSLDRKLSSDPNFLIMVFRKISDSVATTQRVASKWLTGVDVTLKLSSDPNFSTGHHERLPAPTAISIHIGRHFVVRS